MNLATENKLLSARILKHALSIRSFVVEEVALAHLLAGAWKPIGDTVWKQFAKIINPKTLAFSQDAALSFELWLTPEMFVAELEKQWADIQPRANRFLSLAYRRAFREKGEEFPESAQKSDEEDDWEDTLADIARDGSTLDMASGKYAGEREVIGPLLDLIEVGFLAYAATVALPAVKEALDCLRRLQTAENDFHATGVKPKKRRGVLRFPADTPEDVRDDYTKISQLRVSIKNRLSDILTGNSKASLLANLSVASAYNFGFLDYAEREGIEYYKISSILDGKACAACLTMNNKIFSIADAKAYKKKFLSVVGDTEQMKQVTPFLTKEVAQQIHEADGDVSSAGRDYFPPLHINCRCKAIAVPAGELPVQKTEWKKPICRRVEVFMPTV